MRVARCDSEAEIGEPAEGLPYFLVRQERQIEVRNLQANCERG